jgi:hypothetical protein
MWRKIGMGLVAGILAVLAVVAFTGCGPSVHDLAWERFAIRQKYPGVPLKYTTDGVYPTTLRDGRRVEIIMERGKIAGESCVEQCFTEEPLREAPTKKK